MTSVDVAVPCYQYGRFLRDNVESILAQDIDDLRILILDNASTDNTLEVAQDLASTDARISFVCRKHNIGQQANYNEAIDWASSDYFMILDADDVLPRGALKRGMEIMKASTSIAFCHGRELQLDFTAGSTPTASELPMPARWNIESGPQFIKAAAVDYKFIGATTVLRRTVAQKSAGYYHPNLRHANDLNMWLRLATVGDVAETTAVQGIRRIHAGQMTEYYRQNPVRDYVERLANLVHFLEHEGSTLPSRHRLHRDMVRAVAISAMWTGIETYAHGQDVAAQACVDFGVSLHPIGVLPRVIKQVLSRRLPPSALPASIMAMLQPRSADRNSPPAAVS